VVAPARPGCPTALEPVDQGLQVVEGRTRVGVLRGRLRERRPKPRLRHEEGRELQVRPGRHRPRPPTCRCPGQSAMGRRARLRLAAPVQTAPHPLRATRRSPPEPARTGLQPHMPAPPA
jgi:hypothetical protein